jgi:hypothetical protein
LDDTAHGGRPASTRRTLVACAAALLIGSVQLFRMLHFLLQDRFFAVVLAIVAAAIVLNLALFVLFRHRPDLLLRLRASVGRRQERVRRPYGRAARSFFAGVGMLSAAVAMAGGLAMYSAPDFAVFFLLWVMPAAYLAVTGLYIAWSGRRDSFADAPVLLLLWPW